MAGNEHLDTSQSLAGARLQGRKQGLAAAALALGLLSFLNLLGAEKAILALVLGFAALSGATDTGVRRRSLAAIGLAAIYLVSVVIVLVVFRDRLADLIEALNALG